MGSSSKKANPKSLSFPLLSSLTSRLAWRRRVLDVGHSEEMVSLLPSHPRAAAEVAANGDTTVHWPHPSTVKEASARNWLEV